MFSGEPDPYPFGGSEACVAEHGVLHQGRDNRAIDWDRSLEGDSKAWIPIFVLNIVVLSIICFAKLKVRRILEPGIFRLDLSL